MSELAGPWLNLPIMMVPGTGDMVKDIKTSDDAKKFVQIFHLMSF